MALLDKDGAVLPDLEAGIELPLTAVAVGAWVRKATRRTLRLLLFNDLLVLLVGWQLRPRAVRSRTQQHVPWQVHILILPSETSTH